MRLALQLVPSVPKKGDVNGDAMYEAGSRMTVDSPLSLPSEVEHTRPGRVDVSNSRYPGSRHFSIGILSKHWHKGVSKKLTLLVQGVELVSETAKRVNNPD